MENQAGVQPLDANVVPVKGQHLALVLPMEDDGTNLDGGGLVFVSERHDFLPADCGGYLSLELLYYTIHIG